MKHPFTDLFSLYRAKEIAHKVKQIDRYGEVGDRKESVAEHTFSSLMLARVLLKRVAVSLDEERVMLLILYHDLVEIKSGDVFILAAEHEKESKDEKENHAAQVLAQEMPVEIKEEFLSCWEEFLALDSLESQFVRAVEHLDPILHSIEHHEIWGRYGFTAAKLRKKKLGYMQPFPELEKVFNDLLTYMVKEKILSEE